MSTWLGEYCHLSTLAKEGGWFFWSEPPHSILSVMPLSKSVGRMEADWTFPLELSSKSLLEVETGGGNTRLIYRGLLAPPWSPLAEKRDFFLWIGPRLRRKPIEPSPAALDRMLYISSPDGLHTHAHCAQQSATTQCHAAIWNLLFKIHACKHNETLRYYLRVSRCINDAPSLIRGYKYVVSSPIVISGIRNIWHGGWCIHWPVRQVTQYPTVIGNSFANGKLLGMEVLNIWQKPFCHRKCSHL